MKFIGILFVFCGFICPALALDREAFTFTKYDLNVRVEPEQHRLGARGRITLRNDSAAPQKSLALQISSTLNWRSIQLDGKPVQFITHAFASDIDHTGVLSEAILTLPREIPPSGTVELDVGYEGVILLDTTRLTRIGVPEERARHSDWDQISRTFSAVRGIGYVAWYPVASEAANLSEINSVPRAVGHWIARHAETTMNVQLQSTSVGSIFFSGQAKSGSGSTNSVAFELAREGVNVPTLVIAEYQKHIQSASITVEYLLGQEEAAADYGDIAAQIDPLVPVGGGFTSLQILGLPDKHASLFVTEGILLAPLNSPMSNDAELSIAYAKARDLAVSPRPWIQEGLAHYSQAAFIESQKGRQAALDYLGAHAVVLREAETPAAAGTETSHSLINAPDDLYLQTKAMFVWWMLRDMLGNLPTEASLNYRAAEDKDAAYMQRMLEKQTHRDLQWFFDDWVYHDRGLPDFRVDSVFSRPIESGGFLVTITVENLGSSGAEVPLTFQYDGGEMRRRLEVRARSKASLRIKSPGAPQQVVVNDGSVPQSDVSNNTYKIPVQTK